MACIYTSSETTAKGRDPAVVPDVDVDVDSTVELFRLEVTTYLDAFRTGDKRASRKTDHGSYSVVSVMDKHHYKVALEFRPDCPWVVKDKAIGATISPASKQHMASSPPAERKVSTISGFSVIIDNIACTDARIPIANEPKKTLVLLGGLYGRVAESCGHSPSLTYTQGDANRVIMPCNCWSISISFINTRRLNTRERMKQRMLRGATVGRREGGLAKNRKRSILVAFRNPCAQFTGAPEAGTLMRLVERHARDAARVAGIHPTGPRPPTVTGVSFPVRDHVDIPRLERPEESAIRGEPRGGCRVGSGRETGGGSGSPEINLDLDVDFDLDMDFDLNIIGGDLELVGGDLELVGGELELVGGETTPRSPLKRTRSTVITDGAAPRESIPTLLPLPLAFTKPRTPKERFIEFVRTSLYMTSVGSSEVYDKMTPADVLVAVDVFDTFGNDTRGAVGANRSKKRKKTKSVYNQDYFRCMIRVFMLGRRHGLAWGQLLHVLKKIVRGPFGMKKICGYRRFLEASEPITPGDLIFDLATFEHTVESLLRDFKRHMNSLNKKIKCRDGLVMESADEAELGSKVAQRAWRGYNSSRGLTYEYAVSTAVMRETSFLTPAFKKPITIFALQYMGTIRSIATEIITPQSI